MSLAMEWKGTHYSPARGEDKRGRERERSREKERNRERKSAADRRRLRLTFICFICVAAFITGLLILSIFLHVMVVQNEMKIREVEEQTDLERRRQEAIRVEVASLESPARIEQIAVEQLKMVQVALAEYLETPAYQAARAQEQNEIPAGGEMVSDATRGGQ